MATVVKVMVTTNDSVRKHSFDVYYLPETAAGDLRQLAARLVDSGYSSVSVLLVDGKEEAAALKQRIRTAVRSSDVMMCRRNTDGFLVYCQLADRNRVRLQRLQNAIDGVVEEIPAPDAQAAAAS